MDEAAKDFAINYNPKSIEENVEYATTIYKVKEKVTTTKYVKLNILDVLGFDSKLFPASDSLVYTFKIKETKEVTMYTYTKVKKGDEVLVALYVDKSGRLCATMKVYEKLRTDSPYKKDDHVEGIIYETSDNFGVFVAVDDCYSALIPKREAFGRLRVGDRVSARVLKVREDGKLDLSVREKAFLQMDADAAMIMKRMEEYGGKLPFNDKADPEVIKQEFGLSKNAFKRAVGRLLKEGHIKISEKNIEMKKK